MSHLGPDQLDHVHDAVRANLPAAGDAMRLAFDLDACRLEAGEPVPLGSDLKADGPGLAVEFDHGGDRFVVLLPEGGPLPEWYRLPDDDQNSRLRTLAVEWSLCFLPVEYEADRTDAIAVADLREHLEDSNPSAASTVTTLTVEAASSTDVEAAPEPYEILLVGPLSAGLADATPAGTADFVAAEPPPKEDTSKRLLPLEVPITVRLAEKEIDVQQFIALTPGALVSFDKNCEEPLELYVGNQLYARGEAVKIGEKFGLKIDEIGVVRERISNVFEG